MAFVKDLTNINNISGGIIQIDVPDNTADTGYKSYKINLSSFVGIAVLQSMSDRPFPGIEDTLYYVKSSQEFLIYRDGNYYPATGIPLPQGALINDVTNGVGWDANLNIPLLADGVGSVGDFFFVKTTGITELDGINVWVEGDIGWFDAENGVWRKINNNSGDGFSDKITYGVEGASSIEVNEDTENAYGQATFNYSPAEDTTVNMLMFRVWWIYNSTVPNFDPSTVRWVLDVFEDMPVGVVIAAHNTEPNPILIEALPYYYRKTNIQLSYVSGGDNYNYLSLDFLKLTAGKKYTFILYDQNGAWNHDILAPKAVVELYKSANILDPTPIILFKSTPTTNVVTKVFDPLSGVNHSPAAFRLYNQDITYNEAKIEENEFSVSFDSENIFGVEKTGRIKALAPDYDTLVDADEVLTNRKYVNDLISNIPKEVVTVGTGGTYATYKVFAENTNGHTTAYLISNTTETANSVIGGDRNLVGNGNFTLDFGTNYIDMNVNDANPKRIIFENVNFAYANNGGLLQNGFHATQMLSCKLELKGTTFINNTSTATNNPFLKQTPHTTSTYFHFDKIIMNVPNYTYCGLWTNPSGSLNCYIKGEYLRLTGGGSACNYCFGILRTNENSYVLPTVNTIVLDGTFFSSNDGTVLQSLLADNIISLGTASFWGAVAKIYIVNGIITIGDESINKNYNFSNSKIGTIYYRLVTTTSEININACEIETLSGAGSSVDVAFTNIVNSKITTLTSSNRFGKIQAVNSTLPAITLISGASNNERSKFVNTKFTGAVVINADYCEFINCTFDSNVTVNADYVSIIGGHVAGNLSMSSGAEHNYICNNVITGGLTNNSGNITNTIKDNK